ncbi:hypothetical protein [Halorussus sp. MSC15.2]|uniref:hypothetical protein n=1 Tax=Halorussus sp. MSC15.2 TaxID=2283638 RepID=UPI0013D5F761|nr:hypothetical protein [Halorussus sp. MSC15.2]NEU56287.1 hypothetical protein [Halorussus sp. MSC15.2]
MTEDVSRRRVLEASSTLVGGLFVTDWFSTGTDSSITGWVTKGNEDEIDGADGTVETFRHYGSSLCNDGDAFTCRTCDDAVFYLLVPSRSGRPTVGDTYRFRSTGERSLCGNFQVSLRETDSCEDSTPTTTETETTTETDTTTTETETTTETTTDTTTTETTTETTTTETTTETTTTETTTETTTTETTTTETPTDTTTTETTTEEETTAE